MSDQTNGLRFDVYERVHLPDDVAAIDELEEIELVPRIQVIDQGDHAVLKGQLLLSGVYRGQNDSDAPLTLEHWIPVEITLPMNRISRLDDISIEIDNFDVDLLSSRTLNVTGVLSLRGISAQPVQEQEDAWREEPFTVEHQREIFDEETDEEESTRHNAYNEPPYTPEEIYHAAEEAEQSYQQEPVQSDESEATVTISSASSDIGWSSSQLFTSYVARPDQEEITLEESEQEIAESESAREITLASQQSSDDGWLSSSNSFVDPPASSIPQDGNEQERAGVELQPQAASQLEAEIDQSSEQEPIPMPIQETVLEKQEPRVAIASKTPQESGESPPNVGILTLLQTSRREQAARQAAEEVVVAQQLAAEEARVQASGDEIEWKNLFLGKRSEDNDFRKIRLCIVQRDETLDLIASRYSLNPREIINHNRLNESTISEGQLLYIP
ncbi:stage VI sporulation protein D [Paenibacillus castaneae]|uniref:LysM peptidoglycan-binding domain-containing protein n=1 Tax=Paenibacillus castaneae TaxID=474957 RepID=UPI00141B6F3F|nr:LysM peptidoglycan-binding domain-containing protein [Paenibacillus castaneae]NIK75978.1 stage VI sporulation protein D [Paenibacillus castaneae]